MPNRFVYSKVGMLAARAWLLALLFGVWGVQAAYAGLTISPTSWNVIGLDSNNPSSGPNTFQIGARVCNTGGAPVTNVSASFIWDSSNALINLSGSGTITTSSLGAGLCTDFYFPVVVTKTSAAFNTVRGYHITVSGDSVGSVSTPTPRELYVEKIISQGRNSVNSISGPTTVYVGQTYNYTVNASTATQGYQQLEAFLDLSNIVFQVQSISTTYSAPSGATNDKFYADACGWENNPLSANYRSCVGPQNYPGGKAGGTVITTYTVKVLSTGNTTASTLILDFSGSSYHYNSDYGVQIISITSLPPPLTLSKIANPSTLSAPGTVSYTLRLSNTGSFAMTVSDFVDTLPTSPGTATYTTNSSTFNGAAIGNPTISGSTLTWNGSFVVPAGQIRDLVFTASLPAVQGTYTNQAIAHMSGFQIDTTQSTSDNAPATATVTLQFPDLTLAKTHAGNFTQGQTGATYSLTATNSGAANTSGTVTVTDTLPAGLTATAISGTGWTCALGTLTCTRSDALAAGSSYPVITLTVTVANNAAASVTNSGSVSGGGQTNTSNDTATNPTTIDQLPDLTIAKTHTGNFSQGQVGATYSITATNSGFASTSGTVTVTDTLPTGLTATAINGTGWSCVLGTLTCTRSDALAASSSYPVITLTVTVANNAAASVTNSVSVSGGGQTNTANDSTTDPTTVNQLADLTITKSHTGNFTQGQTSAPYTLTVTNSGTGPTSGTVTITDTLPAGLSYASFSGAAGGWSCSAAGQVVTCTNSNVLAVSSSYAALTLNVNVSSTASASVTNSVSVAGGGQVITTNDSASDPTTINQLADLTVIKTHTGNFTQGQTNAPYTLTVTNSGNGPTTNATVTVTDTLPAGLTYASASPVSWSCGAAGQVVTCTTTAVVSAGATYPALTLNVNVSSTAAASVTNNASVAGGGQIITTNDSTADLTTINQLADLTITKTHTGNFTQGQTSATYTLTVTNSGTGPTTGTVTVTDTLPAGLSYASFAGAAGGWSCSAAGQIVTCTNSNVLAASSSYAALTLNVNVSSNAAASVTNNVSVAGGGQIITSNDTASDPTTINQLADLTITKSHTGNFTQGQVGATYSITATNSGFASTSGTVTVTDTLPSGLTATAISGTGWTCVPGTLTCTRSDALAAGSSYPVITLTVNVSLTAAATVTNSATVSGGGENNAANNTASDLTTINPAAPANLSLVKSVSPGGSQIPGTDLLYTVVYTNTGGQPANNVIIVDPYPANVVPAEQVFRNVDFKVGSLTSSPGSTGLVASFEYSNDGGSTWTYTPVSGGGGAPAGYDRAVTNVRWVFAGSLSDIGPNNTGSISLTVRIR